MLWTALQLEKESPEKSDPMCYEKRLTEVYSQFVGYGDTCIDVGVHKGDHYRALKLQGAKVHGFEPCPTFLLDLPSMVQPLALTSPGRPSTLTFCEDLDRPGYSGLQHIADPSREAHLRLFHEVPAMTLDDWIRAEVRMNGFRRIRFLKIDTEGHDVDVLEGASWVISCDNPIIACEWFKEGYTAHGRKAEDLYDWAWDMGYTVGDLWGNLCESREEFLEVVDVSFWDWLLWPKWAVVAGLPGGLR